MLYRTLLVVVRVLLRAFFRRIEVTGLENIPEGRGGLLVAWHPNALVDPGLIMTRFPHPVVFGARHPLFKWPLLGQLLRGLDVVPIYRSIDKNASDEARRAGNAKTLAALAERVAAGRFSSLFPEGISHDLPHLARLKTGAARLYYAARQMQKEGEPPPVIVPVGLHYDKKITFRSRALVWFHPPLELPPELDCAPDPDETEAQSQERVRALTAEIERALHDVVHATDDWETHRILHRGRKLLRAERARRAGIDPGKPAMEDQAVGFARIRAAYYARLESHPEKVAQLRAWVERYDQQLQALGLEEHHLDRDPRLMNEWMVVLLVVQLLFLFLLLPPLLVVGAIVNAPAALLILGLSRWATGLGKDVGTIQILLGAVLFPLTWVGAGVLGAYLHHELHGMYGAIPDTPILAGSVLALVVAVGGVASMRYWRVSAETWRAVRVRLTRNLRRAAVLRAREERAQIYDALVVLAEGLELPGVVQQDGSLRRTPDS